MKIYFQDFIAPKNVFYFSFKKSLLVNFAHEITDYLQLIGVISNFQN